MNKLFKTTVSYADTYFSRPQSIQLSDWLDKVMHGTQYVSLVEQIRAEPDETIQKTLKNKLPVLCVGAKLKGGTKAKHIVKRTGWICFDIDEKDNPNITDWVSIRANLSQIPYVAFLALSVRANGLWGLIKVSDPQKQDLHFQQLLEDFKHIGIQLDSTKGSNPNDLRFYSSDPDAYIADSFDIYDRQPQIKLIFKKKPVKSSFSSTQKKVEEKLAIIEDHAIPIAPDYDSYLKIGFAIASEFGESGRDYFHQAVRYHKKYNFRHAEKQYSACLSPGGIGIGTFFQICKNYNI